MWPSSGKGLAVSLRADWSEPAHAGYLCGHHEIYEPAQIRSQGNMPGVSTITSLKPRQALPTPTAGVKSSWNQSAASTDVALGAMAHRRRCSEGLAVLAYCDSWQVDGPQAAVMMMGGSVEPKWQKPHCHQGVASDDTALYRRLGPDPPPGVMGPCLRCLLEKCRPNPECPDRQGFPEPRPYQDRL